MSVNCKDLISQGYEKDCSREPHKGFGREGIIFNYEDFDWDNIVPGADANLVATFPLKSGGKQGYKIAQFKDPFNGTVKSFHEGTYINTFDKTVMFVALTRDQKQSLQLTDPLANGKVVLILRNEDGGSDGKATFEIFGFHNGLKMTAYENNPYGDAFGGEVFTLQEQEAARSAMYLFNTDVATTEEIFKSYLTPTANASASNNS